MATFLFETPAAVTDEEAAAAIAAVRLFLESETAGEGSGPRVELWSAAGRMEAMGLPIDRATLARGWRAHVR